MVFHDQNLTIEIVAINLTHNILFNSIWGKASSSGTDSLGCRIGMLPNWNEFGEGHFLLPNASADFGYLDAMRSAFTLGGSHEDIQPTEQQKRRFTVLYPRD